MRRFASLALALLLAFPAHAQFIRLAATSGNPAPSSGALPTWRASIAAQYTTPQHTTALFLGDSRTAGQGGGRQKNPNADGSPYYGTDQAAKLGTVAQIAALLSPLTAMDVTYGFVGFGLAGTCASYTLYDPTVTCTGSATWSIPSTASNFYSAGGGFMQQTTNGTDTLSQTQAKAYTKVDVYFPTDPTFGSCTIDNGGSTTTLIESGAQGFTKQTISFTSSTSTLNFKRNAGTCVIAGWSAYNDTIKQITLIRAGFPGTNTANMTDTTKAYGPLAAISAIAPVLGIIDLGANDRGIGAGATSTPQVTTGNYTTNLQTLGQRFLTAGGDVVIVNPVSSAPAYAGNQSSGGTSNVGYYWQTQAIQDSYSTANGAAVSNLRTACSCTVPQVDLYTTLGVWTNVQTNDWEFPSDGGGIHLKARGYAVVAQNITATLTSGLTAVPSAYASNLLVVGGGGGGGGGSQSGSGGGGGGVVQTTGATLYAASTYTITVGGGGAGGGPGVKGVTSSIVGPGQNVLAYSGKGGASQFAEASTTGPFGSGPGGRSTNNSGNPSGGDMPTPGQGNYGGVGGPANYSMSGGGGCSAEGTIGTSGFVGGNGGQGCSNSITGTAQIYGSGGGGGQNSSNGVAGGTGGTNAGNGVVTGTAGSGTANFGGGGGGGGTPGAGGSGVVILSIVTGAFTPTTTGSPTVTTSGGRTIYKYTANGTFVVP